MVAITVEHLAPLVQALDAVDDRWLRALGGLHPSAVIDDDVDAMSDDGMLAVNDALAAVERHCQALHARIANGISKRSAPELGSDGLSRKAGYKSPAKLIAASTGGHPADAQRLIQVGDATAGRMTFTGERAPSRHPHVTAALEAGDVHVAAASLITRLLDKVAFRLDRAALAEAEEALVEQAVGLPLSDVQVILRRAEAYLDPDGLEPKIEDLRLERSLKIREDASGRIIFDGRLDPATGAPVKAAIEALVTAQIRALRGSNRPGEGEGEGGGAGEWTWSDRADMSRHLEQRTIQQLQADALAELCKHVLSCTETVLPLANTTVVVRIPLDALTSGTGVATIDGIQQPVDVGTVRRMAADAEIIPLVLGAESEVLDCGRSRRLFTAAQRLAVIERDGGCAGCGAPPGIAEAHHLRWWSHGGRTSLDNLVLLCSSCHHRIHKDEWEIRVSGPDVWFVPPAHIDSSRTPRLGGRRRYDYRRAADAA